MSGRGSWRRRGERKTRTIRERLRRKDLGEGEEAGDYPEVAFQKTNGGVLFIHQGGGYLKEILRGGEGEASDEGDLLKSKG